MKKTLIFLLVSFTINCKMSAQTGWSSNGHKGDELKGTEAYFSYTYEDAEGNNFIYWSNSDYNFRIISHSHIFDYNIYDQIGITIGFYSADDKLIEKKTNMRLYVSSKEAHFASLPAKKIGRKVLQYLNENKGYIRIIAPLYGTIANFDIKIPCINKELIEEQ